MSIPSRLMLAGHLVGKSCGCHTHRPKYSTLSQYEPKTQEHKNREDIQSRWNKDLNHQHIHSQRIVLSLASLPKLTPLNVPSFFTFACDWPLCSSSSVVMLLVIRGSSVLVLSHLGRQFDRGVAVVLPPRPPSSSSVPRFRRASSDVKSPNNEGRD